MRRCSWQILSRFCCWRRVPDAPPSCRCRLPRAACRARWHGPPLRLTRPWRSRTVAHNKCGPLSLDLPAFQQAETPLIETVSRGSWSELITHGQNLTGLCGEFQRVWATNQLLTPAGILPWSCLHQLCWRASFLSALWLAMPSERLCPPGVGLEPATGGMISNNSLPRRPVACSGEDRSNKSDGGRVEFYDSFMTARLTYPFTVWKCFSFPRVAALCLLDESRNAMLEIAGNYTRAAAVSQTSSPLLAGLFAWWWRLVCG